ncbi:MAG TPA: EamA family transporter [Mycobacteriales bacterium]|nr:EamA family transporter [Mycobacteriales bacterium]
MLALLSSAIWGTSDFLGGTATRRMHPIAVVIVSTVFGGAAALVAAAATGAITAGPGYLGWAALASVSGTTGVVAFYQALATGTMGVIAPTAALGVVVPVIVGLGQGDRPGLAQDAGIVVAIAGVVLASGPEIRAAQGPRAAAVRPLLLALLAAVGFGVAFVAIAHGAETSTLMTLFSMRAISLVLLLVVAAALGSRRVVIEPGLVPLVGVVGLLDVSANATFAYATRHGLLSLVSVLSSLYPAVTVLLARFVHVERLRPVQLAGVAGALAGVALIASGGAG